MKIFNDSFLSFFMDYRGKKYTYKSLVGSDLRAVACLSKLIKEYMILVALERRHILR